ncbi:MAG: hypothetical protein IJ619_05000 [Eubacterium sp.]|nr:hypothetical protein [Eubacterium sp.]
MAKSVFRKKAMDRISSPEQLSEYLRVTTPGIWIVLASIVLLLTGILVWSAVGVLETTKEAKAVVSDGRASVAVISSDDEELKTGMTLRVASGEYIISELEEDDYGRTVAVAQVSLPDGTYDAEIVVEEIHPISFLLGSR